MIYNIFFIFGKWGKISISVQLIRMVSPAWMRMRICVAL